MKLLEERILKDGQVVGDDILKVDSFLNHQIDAILLEEIGKEFRRRFSDVKVTKILTIEASGIAIACMAAKYFGVPFVFAKKTISKNLVGDVYTSKVHSFTQNVDRTIMVSKKFINSEDTVLVLDDFLAKGQAALGLCEIVAQAGAKLAGVGIVIEKRFQEGRSILDSRNIRVESLARITSINEGKIRFIC